MKEGKRGGLFRFFRRRESYDENDISFGGFSKLKE
jgi:hypothetical protein